jgi:hypothetical protein
MESTGDYWKPIYNLLEGELLRVTLFDHGLAELNEPGRRKKEGAGWPPGMQTG